MSDDEKCSLMLLEQYYRNEFEDMVSFASHILGSSSLAEVAVQDTFLIALNRMEKLTASPNPVGWLYITLKNVTKHIQRDRQKQLLRVVALEDIQEIPAEERNADFWMTLDSCRDSDAKLLFEFYVQNRSLKELAEKYGITVGACKMRIKRAKARAKESY